jgi:hypothetical protein
MPDDQAQVKFGADIGDLKAAMANVQATVKEAMDNVADAVNKMTATSKESADKIVQSNEKIQLSFGALKEGMVHAFTDAQTKIAEFMDHFKSLIALLGGGIAFKDSVEATIHWAEEVRELSLTFGMTAGAASQLNGALKIVGIGTEAYSQMAMKLERQIKTNEAALNALKVSTRDMATGALRPLNDIMMDALTRMQKYKAGSDQAGFSLFVFGREVHGVHAMLELNNEVLRRGAELTQKLGLVMGADGIEHTLQYVHTINELKLEFDALEVAIGEALLPYLQKLSSWLAGEGVGLVQAFRQAMETLKVSVTTNKDVWTTFLELLKSIGNLIYAIIQNIITVFREGMMAIQELLKGHLSTAADIMNEAGQIIEYRWRVALEKMHADLMSFLSSFKGAWKQAAANLEAPKPGADELAGHAGKETLPSNLNQLGKGSKGGGAATDLFSQYQEEVNRIKDSQSDLNAWSTAQEYAFWNQKLAAAQQGSALWWQIWHKMAEEYRTMTQEQQKQLEEQHKQAEQAAKAAAAIMKENQQTAIKLEEEKINQLYSLGQISASQRYALLKEQYDRSHTLELKAYQDELAILETRKAKTVEEETSIAQKKLEVMQQIEKANNQHLLKMQQDENAYIKETKTKWDGYATEVGNALTGLLTKHTTMLQTMQTLTERALNAVINGIMKKLVDSWIAGEAAKTQATATGAATRATAESAGAAAGIIPQAAAALKSIATSAATTFAGIFGFLSPVMGPAAVGPAAAGEGAVLAVEGMVSEGGLWEVPGTTAAILHPKETVLPAGIAGDMRNFFSGGAGPSGKSGGDTHVHKPVFNFSGADTEALARRDPSTLMKAVSRGIRDNHMRWRR